LDSTKGERNNPYIEVSIKPVLISDRTATQRLCGKTPPLNQYNPVSSKLSEKTGARYAENV
jgi:hypothetical protein